MRISWPATSTFATFGRHESGYIPESVIETHPLLHVLPTVNSGGHHHGCPPAVAHTPSMTASNANNDCGACGARLKDMFRLHLAAHAAVERHADLAQYTVATHAEASGVSR